MLTLPELRRFYQGFGTPPETGCGERLERVLATGRALLAVAALVAIYVDPTEPSRYARLAYGLLAGYVAYSLLILVLLRFRRAFAPRTILWIHGADLLWAAVICLFTEGPNSPFFLFFVFALCAAAYRWRLLETVATALMMVGILISEALLLSYGPIARWLASDYELNRFLMRGAYLLILGFLLGYLAEQEKRLRAEIAVVPHIMGKARVEDGLRATMQGVLGELLRIFDAQRTLLAIKEASSGRMFLWQVLRAQASAPYPTEPPPAEQQTYLFPVSAFSWHARRGGRQPPATAGGGGFALVALDEEGRRISHPVCELPEGFRKCHPFRSLMAATVAFGDEYSGRLFLLDPGARGDRAAQLQFLQNLLRQVTPAIYNVYLLQRLRTRAGAMERARVARELHDSTIQSLLATEIRVDVLRRKATGDPAAVAEELSQIQQLLRKEILNLRELLQQVKPIAVNPKELLDFLAGLVETFRQQTGISASFVCGSEEITLPARVCRDLARIVQEALMNVLKHSDARNVVVRFTVGNGLCQLVIDDDGRGFEFPGRFTLAELERERRGPLIIRERVRSIGADLTLESHPGRGARLEITFPQRNHG